MNQLFNVTGKKALVTGGSSGIGLMIAQGLVEAGADVTICSRKAEVCRAVAAELSKRGTCSYLAADLSSTQGALGLVAALKERTEGLDILVNNAGTNWGAEFGNFPEEGWDKVVSLNLKSIFFLTQALANLLEKPATAEDPSRIINIGSVDGIHVPTLETYAYSAAKAGVHHMTRVLARKLASRNITVNAVAPGAFESKMMKKVLEDHGSSLIERIPRKRIGKPADMAGVVIYLASQAGAYVTGAVIPVDGGVATTR